MTNTLYNLARMTTTTTGTGTVSLLSAVSGYLSFEDAGVQDADVVTYAIHEGSNSEVGQGTYTSSGATLSRDVVYASTNNGSQITLSGNAQVFITAAAEDFASLVDASGTPSDSQIAVWTDANTIEGASSLTYDGTTLTANGTIKLQEAAAAAADTAGYGQIWVKNDSPNTLYFTDDTGTDYPIATTSGSGFVDTSGTPSDNQIAVFTDADTIEGDAGLTYTSGVLQVGSGDSGATIDAGADNFQIKTSATADLGMTISDGGTASTHKIEMRSSDDRYSQIQTGFDTGTPADLGLRLTYYDGTNYQAIEFDPDREEIQFFSTSATAPTGGTLTDPDDSDDFMFIHRRSAGGMRLVHGSGGSSYISAGDDTDATLNQYIVFSDGTGRITFGVGNASRVRIENESIKQLESSAASTDDGGFGQWWVKDDTPNIPKFTDDAGNDYSIVLDTKAQDITGKTSVESDYFEADNGYTVATLPTPTVGMIARVTDADTPAVGSTVVGSGAAAALVWYNGSNWTVIGI